MYVCRHIKRNSLQALNNLPYLYTKLHIFTLSKIEIKTTTLFSQEKNAVRRDKIVQSKHQHLNTHMYVTHIK